MSLDDDPTPSREPATRFAGPESHAEERLEFLCCDPFAMREPAVTDGDGAPAPGEAAPGSSR